MTSKKKIGVVVAGLAVAGVAALGTAAALNIIDGPTQILSVFESDTQTSAFDLTATDSDLRGKHRITASWTVKNTDNTTHDARITVQLLDDSGVVITDNGTPMSYNETVTVDGGATHTSSHAFQKQGLVSEYESTFVTVDQLTS